MVDVGPFITGDDSGWRPSIGQLWQWRHVGLQEEDVIWLEKMLALAHEGHSLPDRCWITFESLRG